MATSRVISERAANTAGTAALSAASVSGATSDEMAATNSSASIGAADSTNSRASLPASSTSVLGGGLLTMPKPSTPSQCPLCGAKVWAPRQHARWHSYANA